MARSRKPDPVPTPLGSFPPDAMLEERTRYLLQELGEEAGFLEQWIVHYLAELLDRADDSKAAPRVRSEARVEIAGVIPALWEQQIAHEALHVRHRVDDLLGRFDTLESEAERLLGPLLIDPNRVADLPEAEVPYALRALHTLAEHATRFLFTTTSAERSKQEVASEAVRRFLQRDKEVQGLQADLARFVPDFATVNPTDLRAVERLVHSTLVVVSRVQLALLTRVAPENDE